MTELKTLNDINWFEVGNGPQQIWAEEAFKELRKEAIKWVKSRCSCSYPDTCDCWPEKFIEFFNLTEEDLK